MRPAARLAAVQFAVGSDVPANLATVVRMIDRAGEDRPDVMVLPEFCNHLSVYESADHAREVAVDLDGPWIDAVGERAARHSSWVQLNCTVRRADRLTNTNLVFAPDGTLAAANDKTVLMGAEGEHLSPAGQAASLVESAYGTLGSYACMDGVITEVPRGLAVRGARVLLNSLNSFALDEASLHIPVRAAENKVWLVAACKVGPLLPEHRVVAFSEAMKVPAAMLRGAGESQIVDPAGEVVVRAPRDGEAVVAAEVDLRRSDDKRRPDGTDVMAARRPELYAPLARPTPRLDEHPRAARLAVAALSSLEEVKGAVRGGAELVVLPELSAPDVAALAGVAGAATVVCSVRRGDAHVGVAVHGGEVVGEQLQLHRPVRHGNWLRRLGDGVTPVDLPWGRLGIVVGDDSIFPEVARLCALASCDVLAVPFRQLEAWETSLGLIERGAENRVCLVAANGAPGGESLVVDLPPDFTLWAPSRQRPFDGTINQPDVFRGASVVAQVHPARAVNRQISKGTNLVDGRPWRLAAALVG